MSGETIAWLNENVLVGYGHKPWHFNEAVQSTMDKSNLYAGPIPKEDVAARLFDWQAEAQPLHVEVAGEFRRVPGRVAVTHGETGEVFGLFRSSYKIHQYRDWLLDNVACILDDSDLGIASAGLLVGGGVAFVTVKPAEEVVARCGMGIDSKILAATSHNGSLASTYKMVATLVVCDNTLQAALAEFSPVSKTRHTKHSTLLVDNVRDALGLLGATSHAVVNWVDGLADTPITDAQWESILDSVWPDRPKDSTRVRARLANRRATVDELYRNDPRCNPWRGSALGAFQALNTHRLHVAGPGGQGFERFERNTMGLLFNKALTADADDLRVILDVARGRVTPPV